MTEVIEIFRIDCYSIITIAKQNLCCFIDKSAQAKKNKVCCFYDKNNLTLLLLCFLKKKRKKHNAIPKLKT